MKEYVLDTNAVIRFLRVGGGGGGERVRALFAQADWRSTRLFMSAANLGEVYYVLLRHMDETTVGQRTLSLQKAVTIISIDHVRAIEAARLKHKYKLGYADSFAAALAMERGAALVSADPSFEQCGRALKWLRLPPFRG